MTSSRVVSLKESFVVDLDDLYIFYAFPNPHLSTFLDFWVGLRIRRVIKKGSLLYCTVLLYVFQIPNFLSEALCMNFLRLF